VNQDSQIPQYNDDEIDLFELIETLWNEKLLIILITAVFALGGVSYSLLATPVYEARSSLLPPTQKDIAELSKSTSSLNSSVSTDSVYSSFVRVLESNQLRADFIDSDEAKSALVEEGMTPEGVWKRANEAVKVNKPSKGALERVDVVASHSSPEVSARLANLFVELAVKRTREQLISNFNEGIAQKISSVRDQIASRQATYSQNLDIEILKLQSALNIARQINQKTPIDIQQMIEAGSSTSTVDELRRLYRLGSDALEAEIAMLAERKKLTELVPGLSGLQQELALLEATDIDTSRINPAQVDLVAMVPESRVKPKRTLIVALAIVLGGMIGVVFVLIRQAVRKRSQRVAR